MDRREILQNKRKQILEIGKRYGARNIRVFGSVARNEARPESDFDFLVELEQGRSLFDLGGLSYDLQELLNAPVDVVTINCLKPHMRARVLSEAVTL